MKPVTIVVPALYSYLPAESMAMGWLNEIDALTTIRHRMICAAKITGWDVFTFHTLHNLDHYFDTTINAVRDTWVKEGSLSIGAVRETKLRFGKPYDYYRVQPRLIENLVFQSSILDWLSHGASNVPLRYHVIGTGLISALVSSGSITFVSAVRTALNIGARWDASVQTLAQTEAERTSLTKTADEVGWLRFEQIRKLLEARASLSLAVAREDLELGSVQSPSRPFWYSPTSKDTPVLIETARDAAYAMETLDIASWSSTVSKAADEPIRGWLISALHPLARACRWTVSNYLLATPQASILFLDHIATLGRSPVFAVEPEPAQNRFRLSRIKVTGP
ncbi:MAG: hypothetical protein HY646_14600 [Acidobacteria bacterium]|nr:hypothetical protein [Acidobacteriota bacterium]